MKPNTKVDVMLLDTAVTNGETATCVVDTKGFDFCSIDVVMSTSDNTSNNPSTLQVTECTQNSTTGAVTFGLTGDSDFSIPAAVTSGDWAHKFNIDLRGRKRYLLVTVTPLTTQAVVVTANLSQADESVDAASGDMKGVTSI